MCRAWRQRERTRPGLHGHVDLVWPRRDTKPTASMPFPPLSKLAFYKGQSPFASNADRPRCKLAALASALEESSATTSPTFIISSTRLLNPSVYSFVRDCPAILAVSAQSVADQCSNRAPFLLPA